MSATIVQQRVKDYEAWRKEFDAMRHVRASMGADGDQVYRDSDDPHKVTIILKWKSLADARKYFNSPELKAAISRAGVEGPQSISFAEEK